MNTEQQRYFIGQTYGGSGAFPFLGTQNLDEARTIFWSPGTLAGELRQQAGQMVPLQRYSQLEARLAALADWIARGHTLVLIGSSTLPFAYVNQKNAGVNTRLEQMAPLNDVEFVVATGSRVEYCGPLSGAEVFSDQLGAFRYENLIKSKTLVPLLRVAAAAAGGELQVLGGYRKVGLGMIVYIPPFSGPPPQIAAFFDKIERLPQLLKGAPSQLPPWVSRYQSSAEKTLAGRIVALEQEATMLRQRIDAEQAAFDAQKELKVLLAGSGSGFANGVKLALEELGLSVVDGPHPRADFLSAHAGGFIAIEAKGVDGPAREAQFRQAERWIAEVNSTVSSPEEAKADPDLGRYAMQLAQLSVSFQTPSQDCKGFLVIGTFRSTPLAERTEPDFPEPVVRVLNRSKVCALTGVQLYSLVMEARANPEIKAEIVDELVNTCGVLSRGRDWSQVLEKVE